MNSAETRTSSGSLLLIEDNDLDVEFIRRLVRRTGIEVSIVRARDGEEALALLRSDELTDGTQGTSSVLLDLNMPRMDGFELLSEIRNDSLLKNIPVYVLTTSNSEKDRAMAKSLGVAGFFVKPISHEELQIVLAKGLIADFGVPEPESEQ